ncbi:hypothetical protein EON65_51370, partial [archaeon]
MQVDKLLKELNEKSAKASEASTTILESSMEKNLEELFKLLLVTNEIYHEHIAKGGAEHDHDEDEHDGGQEGSGDFKSKDKGEEEKRGRETKRPPLPHLNSSHSIISHTPSFTSLPVDVDVDNVYTQAQNLENWESKSLDLKAMLPNILINEVSHALHIHPKYTLHQASCTIHHAITRSSTTQVSTLLLDMQRVWHRRKVKQEVEKILFGKERGAGVG